MFSSKYLIAKKKCCVLHSLLKEAQPIESKRLLEMGEEYQQTTAEEDQLQLIEDERKLLSRYGIWLLVELCTPRDDIPIVCTHILITHLVKCVDQWCFFRVWSYV